MDETWSCYGWMNEHHCRIDALEREKETICRRNNRITAFIRFIQILLNFIKNIYILYSNGIPNLLLESVMYTRSGYGINVECCRQTMRRSALTYNMWRGNRCDTITAMMYYLINEYNDFEANIECASNSFSLLDHLFIWGDRWRRYEQDI